MALSNNPSLTHSFETTSHLGFSSIFIFNFLYIYYVISLYSFLFFWILSIKINLNYTTDTQKSTSYLMRDFYLKINDLGRLRSNLYTTRDYFNFPVSEWLLFNVNSAIFSAISWREQVIFQWEYDEVHFVLDQLTDLDFYSAISLKQQSAVRHVAPHIILIPSQPSLCSFSLMLRA